MPEILPRQAPKQGRSSRTLERIVQASLEIIREEGPDRLTVHAIVQRAGSSVGSFYARFSGKDELLAYLGERSWREAAGSWDETAAALDEDGLTLPELIERAVRLLGEAMRSGASHLRALCGAPVGRREASALFQAHVLEGLERVLLRHSGEMSHPDPEVGVKIGLRAVMAVLTAAPEPDHPAWPSGERVEKEAAALLTAYLTGGRPGGAGPGSVDFFDVWG